MKYTFLLASLCLAQAASAQLTIYSEPGQSGTSATCAVSTIFKGTEIPGGLQDQVSSIHLQKDFMATLSENEDGSGESYTFVAAVGDIRVDLSRFLNDKVSFIRVLPYRAVLKKGVGNQNNAWIDQLNVSWFYDWGALDVTLPEREYVMNAWGRQAAANPANIANYINKPEVTHLLSFNEPDNVEQSNIPVADAIPLHRNLAATGLRIGSPAPTESQAFVWLRDFVAGTRAANNKMDHIVIHWYDWGSYLSTLNTAPNPTDVFNRFRDYVNRVYSIYGKPIWIKEFNANRNTTSATHEGFIALALPWLEQQPFIERYAYFFPPALPPVDGSGNITPIGKAYRDFNASTPAITRNIDNTELFGDDTNKKLEAEVATRLGSNVVNCTTASGGQMVQAVTGSVNRVAFHNVVVPEGGEYTMKMSYFSITNRTVTLRINHAPAQVVNLPASGSLWCFQNGSPGEHDIQITLLPGSNTIEFTEAPIFDFIQLTPNNPLPVSLLDLKGRVQPKAIELQWLTAQETNSQHFEVMKSVDGVNYTMLGKVQAAGNSTVQKTYSYTDNTPDAGTNFYKLKMVDKDGSFTHSKSIVLHYNIGAQGLRLVQANATAITVTLEHPVAEQGTLLLMGMDGRVLHQQAAQLQQGANMIRLNAGLPAGQIGLISLRSQQGMSTIKVMR